MQEHRGQGLCFNCDEKFINGHRFSTRKFLLLTVDDEDSHPTNPPETTKVETPTMEPDNTYFQLSPQTISGHFFPKTLKFKGLLNGLTVTILIDTTMHIISYNHALPNILKSQPNIYPIFL